MPIDTTPVTGYKVDLSREIVMTIRHIHWINPWLCLIAKQDPRNRRGPVDWQVQENGRHFYCGSLSRARHLIYWLGKYPQ